MGERANGVNEPPRKAARALENEITEIRSRLDVSLAELDRRRHELMDLRLQMTRHPLVFAGAGAAVVFLLGGVGYSIYRSRKREELPQKARRLRIAMGRAVDKPHKVARGEAPIWEKIVAAVGVTIATSLAKKLVERTWNQTVASPR
jgi:hypothetical protein